jgi:hypothetical protein
MEEEVLEGNRDSSFRKRAYLLCMFSEGLYECLVLVSTNLYGFSLSKVLITSRAQVGCALPLLKFPKMGRSLAIGAENDRCASFGKLIAKNASEIIF